MMADEEDGRAMAPLECLLHQAAHHKQTSDHLHHQQQTKRSIAAALESRGREQFLQDEAAKKKRLFPLDYANRGSAFPIESAAAGQPTGAFDRTC
jgi:hypothetical protein